MKFASSRNFFGKAELAIFFEGRNLTTEEQTVLVEAVELNSDISISMIYEPDSAKTRSLKSKIDRMCYENTLEHARIIRGSIKSGQELSFESSVVILGNVKPGAKISARGNILIFGCLEGEAHAGAPDDDNCFIVAEDIKATVAQIGTCRSQVELQEKWYQRVRRRDNEGFVIAKWHDTLLLEPLKGGLLKKI